MSIFSTVWGAVSAPLNTAVQGWSDRRTLKAEHKLKLDDQNFNLKMAKVQSKIKQVEDESNKDFSYDQQVLENRSTSSADEIILLIIGGVFVCHFIPYTQPYMAQGWQAMGYDGVPMWFEFCVLGAVISTLGLMRLFRLFITRKDGEK